MNTSSVSAVVAAILLAGCATDPASRPAASAAPAATPSASATGVTQVFFYPQRGQSPVQQDRDRYECFDWAVAKSGFDPSRRAVPARYQEQLLPVRADGATIVGGTLMGAAIGAAVAEPWHRGEGAAVGAIAGTALGALTANAQASAMHAAQRQERPVRTGYEQQAAEYRRAMSACLEGRGYVVK